MRCAAQQKYGSRNVLAGNVYAQPVANSNVIGYPECILTRITEYLSLLFWWNLFLWDVSAKTVWFVFQDESLWGWSQWLKLSAETDKAEPQLQSLCRFKRAGKEWEVVKINCYWGFKRIKSCSLFLKMACLQKPSDRQFPISSSSISKEHGAYNSLQLLAKKMRLLMNMNLGACAAHCYLNTDIPVFLEYCINVLNGNFW